MEDGGRIPRSNRKRPFLEDLENDGGSNRKPPFLEDLEKDGKPPQKKVRFPKGKKVKKAEGEAATATAAVVEEGPADATNPRLAATERAKRRSQITAELFDEGINDGSATEIDYESNENFVEDGIQIEPFNLEKEREEGYFDEEGNFVEYVKENEIKDAWLDSVEVIRYAAKSSTETANEDDSDDDAHELSSEDIGVMKRRIANLLEPGETVLQALRRLKGSSDKKKEKMSAETQRLFDQLTEDANKLLDHGEYNVYQEKQEVFLREAEGYERLARARGENTDNDLYLSVTNLESGSSVLSNSNVDAANPNLSTADISNNGADEYDIFADDDDDNAVNNPSSHGKDVISSSNIDGVGQSSSDRTNTASESGTLLNDYVYDESSGYYYSSSLGYYYDPNTGLYCQASSGQWYSFNEETGTYDEVHENASTAN